jgi:putative membrane protein
MCRSPLYRLTAAATELLEMLEIIRAPSRPGLVFSMLLRLVWHWLVLVVGLYLVTLITPISYSSPKDLLWAALVLMVFNAIIKPILVFFTLPLVLLTLGLFLFIINAIILYCVPDLVPGFHVPGFFSAFIGSLILSLVTALFTGYEKRRVSIRRINARPRNDKVIDI